MISPSDPRTTLDLDTPQTSPQFTHREPLLEFSIDENTSPQQSPTNKVTVTVDRDLNPGGITGMVMKWFGFKRQKTARILWQTFSIILIIAGLGIVAWEFFISLSTTPIPSTIPLVRDIPIIE